MIFVDETKCENTKTSIEISVAITSNHGPEKRIKSETMIFNIESGKLMYPYEYYKKEIKNG